MKDISEDACLHGLNSTRVLGNLSDHFKRTVQFRNTLYMGQLDGPSMQRIPVLTRTKRIGIRFKAHDYENICTLAFALDVTPSRATALLLEASVTDNTFMNPYLEKHMANTLDENRLKELKKVIKFLNANNPYEERISWLNLLTYIFREIKEGSASVHDTLVDYINKWR